jgi:lipopolysaccharide/colanic/teichoic acid biosynthesis glycosyltransferase
MASSLQTSALTSELSQPDLRRRYVISDGRSRSTYLFFKRLVDLILSSFLLVLLAPLMLLIVIVIRLDSPGKAIFVQERLGAVRRRVNGRKVWVLGGFRFYKFRSMFTNVDTSLHEQYARAFVAGTDYKFNSNGQIFKLTNDPRVSRVGRWLRKSSLDELPQLFNVLKGDMSLVGPRPLPLYEVAQYQDWHFQRFAAPPGITGIWQVKGRCQVPFRDMVRMDIDYIRNSSIWWDLKLLFLTIPAVLSGRGAA